MGAFRVICDETNNLPEDIAQSRLHATILFDTDALVKRLSQDVLKRLKDMVEIKCLICGKALVPLDNDYPVNSHCWNQSFIGADAWEIACDHGSIHNTDKFILGLCDECITAKKEAGLLILNGSILDDIENALW